MRYYKYEFLVHGDVETWEKETEIHFIRLTQEWINRQYVEDLLVDVEHAWPQLKNVDKDIWVIIKDIADGEENTLGRLHIQQAANGVITHTTSAIQEF